MEKKRLGSSNHFISGIGLGCWQFARSRGAVGKFWGEMDDELVGAIIAESLKNGVNWFDTAEIYGNGTSEQRLSAALREQHVKAQDIMIATKWNPVLRLASSIERTFGEREKNLAPYPVALLQVHNPTSLSSIPAQMKHMAALVQQHKVELIGVSNFSKQRMRKAQQTLEKEGLSLTSNQMRYNLLDRSIEFNGVLQYARDHRITIIAYSPLAQGLLTGRYHEQQGLIQKRPGFRKYMPAFRESSLKKSLPLIQSLREIAEEHHVTPAQIALRWVVQFNGDSVVAIPGASSAHQASQNAAAMDFQLTSAELNLLDELSRSFTKSS